jgi:AraC-like DNA-binding protein
MMTTAQFPDETDYQIGTAQGFCSSNPDEVEIRTEKLLQCDHQMTVLAGQAPFRARVAYSALDGFSLMATSYGPPIEIVCVPPIPWVTISFHAGGESVFTHSDGRSTRVGGSRAAILTYEHGVRMRRAAGVRALMVAVPKARVERYLERILQRPLDEPLRFESAVDLDGDGRGIAGAVATARRVLARYAPDVPPPIVAAELEHSILSSLLFGHQHNYMDAMLSPSPLPSSRMVDRVLELVHSAWETPLTVADLADVAGVSERSLYTAFQQQLGASPMAYVRRHRLERAHDELLGASPNGRTTVIGVALRNGFTHAGRFAAAYRRRFGESPSETLRR